MLQDLVIKNEEHWIDTLIVEKIEEGLKKHLKCEDVYYYFVNCPGKDFSSSCVYCDSWKLVDGESKGRKHPTVWLGSGLLKAIRKMQKYHYSFREIVATSARTKGKIDDEDFIWRNEKIVGNNPNRNTYWIGDCSQYGRMICGDDAWVILWNRLNSRRKKVAGEL